ncbi:MAG: alginate export family protein, partial [Acidobacteria bacterium]|nr:alginate export family protein [Acidobacteriota bacterium]
MAGLVLPPVSLLFAQTPPPAYQLDRSEEDWSWLRDPARRTDVWDPLKYIRLGRGRDHWYVTLG